EERVKLLCRRPGVTADLVDVGHVAFGCADAVDDQVSRARHRNRGRKALCDDLAVFSCRERPAIPIEGMALATPEADRASGGAREDEPDAGTLRERGRQARPPGLDRLQES